MSANDPSEWDAWAPTYGREVDWVEEIHNPDLAGLLPCAGKRVLDVGCGTGRRALALFGRAGSLLAVDSSRGMVEVARGVLAGVGQCEVRLLDIAQNELPAGMGFDVVLAASVMHHVRDAVAAVGRIKASMAPGGTLVIIDALSGRPFLARAGYYLEMSSRHDPLRLAGAFLNAFVLNTRVSRHKSREAPLTLEDFRRRYGDLLAGARVEVRHGIFGYLIWRKPA